MNKSKIRKLFVLGYIITIGIGFLTLSPIEAKTLSEALEAFKITELKAKPPAPDFQLKDLNGNVVSLQDYRGKPVILYFWATW
jgi:cytochrome oxidase Cu insertion factor (SCO1/SenC/PrrC family)